MSSPVLDVRLSRADHVYRPGESVRGAVCVWVRAATSHSGLGLCCEGAVASQNVVFSFGTGGALAKPVSLVQHALAVAPAGKLHEGANELPFEFKLEPLLGQQLHESYKGCFLTVLYSIKATLSRGMLSRDVSKAVDLIVEVPGQGRDTETPQLSPSFFMSSDGDNSAPRYRLEVALDSLVCDPARPFTGTLAVRECAVPIESIDLRLDRDEVIGSGAQAVRRESEVVRMQVADGDVARGTKLTLFCIFPRLHVCPSLSTSIFRVEWKASVVLKLQGRQPFVRTVPLKIVRPDNNSNNTNTSA
eukprot:m51a1_g9489 Down syndrome critical region protein 3 paralogue B (303) ;mRNA; f:636669-637973